MAEVAAGFVIIKNLVKIEYLLLQTSYGIHHWTPPKGHVEGNEDLLETAYRETEEEAGISKPNLHLFDYKDTIYYDVKGKRKAVTYFLAEVDENTEVKLSHEHQDLKWAPIDEACELVNFSEMQKVLRNCDEYLKTKK